MNWEWSVFLLTLWVAVATIVVLRGRFRFALAVLALGFVTMEGAALWREARNEQSQMRVERAIPLSTRAGTERITAR